MSRPHAGQNCSCSPTLFVGQEVSDDGTLRLWTRWWGYHPDEDTLEFASRFDLRKVHQCMSRVGLRVEEAVAVVDFLA